MNERSTRQSSAEKEVEENLLSRIDDAMVASPVLDAKLMADVERLKRDISIHCEKGKTDEAERVTQICLNIIRQDDPAKE